MNFLTPILTFPLGKGEGTWLLSPKSLYQKVPVHGELVEPPTCIRSSFDKLRTNGHEF
jgi:hypothetical protein